MIVFAIIGFLFVLTVFFFFLYRYEALRANGVVVAEGPLDRVAHESIPYCVKRGGVVKRGKRVAYQEFTMVHFTDGRSFRVPGIWHAPYDRGTLVRIRKNKWNEYVVEEVRDR